MSSQKQEQESNFLEEWSRKIQIPIIFAVMFLIIRHFIIHRDGRIR